MGSKGENSSFKALDHVTSYPIVSDSIDAVKANPYGKKALELSDNAIQGAIDTAGPILRKPYSVAEPYIKKADELAVSGLQKVDEHVPLLKEDTQTVIDTGKSYAFWPYAYVNDVWTDEYNKVASDSDGKKGLWVLIVAIISAGLHIISDFIQLIREVIMPKVKEAQKKSPEYVRRAQDAAQQYKQIGQEKVNEYTKFGQQKADDFKSQAQQSADSTSRQAQQTADQAKYQAHQTKEDAKAQAGSK